MDNSYKEKREIFLQFFFRDVMPCSNITWLFRIHFYSHCPPSLHPTPQIPPSPSYYLSAYPLVSDIHKMYLYQKTRRLWRDRRDKPKRLPWFLRDLQPGLQSKNPRPDVRPAWIRLIDRQLKDLEREREITREKERARDLRCINFNTST
jgi:hypothetical protein